MCHWYDLIIFVNFPKNSINLKRNFNRISKRICESIGLPRPSCDAHDPTTLKFLNCQILNNKASL